MPTVRRSKREAVEAALWIAAIDVKSIDVRIQTVAKWMKICENVGLIEPLTTKRTKVK